MKKITALLLVVMFLAIVIAEPASAASSTYSSTGRGFSQAWEATASGTSWLIKYGYNTAWINEDYTHTYHSSKSHVAIVSNANGSFTDYDIGGYWAGIEVTHSGSYVTYTISY